MTKFKFKDKKICPRCKKEIIKYVEEVGVENVSKKNLVNDIRKILSLKLNQMPKYEPDQKMFLSI